MDEFPFSALFLFAQSCLTDAVNVIFSDYCFTDTYLTTWGHFFPLQSCGPRFSLEKRGPCHIELLKHQLIRIYPRHKGEKRPDHGLGLGIGVRQQSALDGFLLHDLLALGDERVGVVDGHFVE